MSVRHIHTKEITEICLASQQNPMKVKANYPQYGEFSVSSIVLPEFHIMDLNLHVADSLVMHDTDDVVSHDIDINFVLQDNLFGDFSGVDMNFQMRGGQHNLKYTPGQKHQHKVIRDEHVRMFHLSLNPNYFQQLVGCDDHWSEMVQRSIERGESFMGCNHFPEFTPAMHALIRSIQHHVDEGTGSRLKLHSMIFELLALQVDQFKSLHGSRSVDHVSVNDMDKLYQIRQYIEAHFLEDLSLSGLCRLSMLNEFKLKKGFKTVFGTSVMQHVKQLRMEYAQRLLRDDRRPIEEIAAILGYQYPNHFSAAYKKHFGEAPSRVYSKPSY